MSTHVVDHAFLLTPLEKVQLRERRLDDAIGARDREIDLCRSEGWPPGWESDTAVFISRLSDFLLLTVFWVVRRFFYFFYTAGRFYGILDMIRLFRIFGRFRIGFLFYFLGICDGNIFVDLEREDNTFERIILKTIVQMV